MPKVLLIDDDDAILHALRRVFRGADVALLTADSGGQGVALTIREQPDVVLLDLQLPDQSGLDVFRRIQEIDARIPVIFITGHGTTDTAIEAIKRGAYEYLLKPLELEQIRTLVARACETSRLMHVPAVVAEQDDAPATADLLVGRCAAMQDVYKAIGRVAPQDVTVLLQGETGAGKELVARAIYQHSRRARGPFLAISCAAIPEQLLESELFGHERGAFTGAERKRIGKFEQCSRGTLFLDEIGDMSPVTQAKILRVLQEQRFERVGGNETIQTDVRIIAATNRPLARMVASGEFRSDLYYRLGVFAIELPPLRERLEDLPLLVEYFIKRFSVELGKSVQLVAPETMDCLRRYPWPGNLRELQSALKQALLQATGPLLAVEFLPAFVRETTRPEGSSEEHLDWEQFIARRIKEGSHDLYSEALAVMERSLLLRVLRQTDGNQLQAAKILGITRGSLRHKIRALGIAIGRTIDADAEGLEGE
jgi:two-component system nitrogen regulation response regulator GlnG